MANDMFRAPIHRAMRILDRSKFERVVGLKAARVFDNKDISSVRTRLERSKDVLQQDRLASVQPDPDVVRAEAGKKCILLRPEGVSPPDAHNTQTNGHTGSADVEHQNWPHSPTLTELARQGLISIVPFNLHLKYDYWTYLDIISAILPEDEQGELPSGFSQVGHVAHLNLREDYLKYKYLIAEILMDKNPGVRTVINKIDDVGEENEYRTFKYEVLAGPDNMNVTVSEANCTFRFNYSRVYWNPRLETEHRRLVNQFKQGDAVCDVMAGVGPFAVPAGKKGVFVWANDLNPDSFSSLQDAIKRNKVSQYVQPFNVDGRSFIRNAPSEIARTDYKVNVFQKTSGSAHSAQPVIAKTLVRPKVFTHFVLNLPASALTFLPSFVGLYPPALRENLPDTIEMPLLHVYCFSTKSDDNVEEGIKICKEIGRQLNHDFKPGNIESGGVQIHDVRDVAPKKRMFCATFRLPEGVAFRDR